MLLTKWVKFTKTSRLGDVICCMCLNMTLVSGQSTVTPTFKIITWFLNGTGITKLKALKTGLTLNLKTKYCYIASHHFCTQKPFVDCVISTEWTWRCCRKERKVYLFPAEKRSQAVQNLPSGTLPGNQLHGLTNGRLGEKHITPHVGNE